MKNREKISEIKEEELVSLLASIIIKEINEEKEDENKQEEGAA